MNGPKAEKGPCLACGVPTFFQHQSGAFLCRGCQGRILYSADYRKKVADRLQREDEQHEKRTLRFGKRDG